MVKNEVEGLAGLRKPYESAEVYLLFARLTGFGCSPLQCALRPEQFGADKLYRNGSASA